jgi:hypothetical protein
MKEEIRMDISSAPSETKHFRNPHFISVLRGGCTFSITYEGRNANGHFSAPSETKHFRNPNFISVLRGGCTNSITYEGRKKWIFLPPPLEPYNSETHILSVF